MASVCGSVRFRKRRSPAAITPSDAASRWTPRLENRLSGLLPDRDEAGDWLDELLPDKEELTEAFHSAMERLESRLDALEQRRSAIDRRLLRAFPDLRSKEHPKAMQKLRELKQKKSKE